MGVDCNQSAVRQTALPVLPGHWRQHALSLDVRTCPTPAACLGGTNVSTQCLQNQTGPYCSQCLPGQYRGTDGLCVTCRDTLQAALPVLVFAGACLLVVGLYVLRARTLSQSMARQSFWETREGRLRLLVASVIAKVRRAIEWGSVKGRILVSLFQVRLRFSSISGWISGWISG